MSELLLVSNPKRRRKKAKSRKHRQPAALRAYWAAKRGQKKATRRHRRRKTARVSAGRRVRRRHSRPANARTAVGYTVGSRKIRRRKLNPHRRHRHRLQNPSIRGIVGQVVPTVKAGAWGAAGALSLDVLWGLVVNQLPSVAAYLTNPYVGFAAKAMGAVAVGALGGKVARGRGRDLAVGAMTVVTHDFLKTMLQQMAPTIFGTGGSLPLGAYLGDGGLGAYLGGAAPIVGTATIPQAYLPFSGSSGASGSDGVYAEDHSGMDPWGV